MNKTILTIACLLVVNSVFAADNVAPTICNYEKLMQCLKITSQECTQSMNLSIELCTSNIDLNDDTYEVSEIAKKLAPCMSVQFLNQSGLTQASMDICNKEFNNANTATLKWLKHKTKEADDCFFKDDDDPCNYKQ